MIFGAIVFPPVPWPVPLLVGCAASLALTPVIRHFAMTRGIVDHPTGGRKIHTRVTPLMGGVAVYLAFVIAALTVLPLIKPVIGVLVGGLAAIVVGFLDERYNLRPLVHLAGQTCAALIAIVAGVGVVKSISIPTAAFTTPGFKVPLIAGAALTLFWLVGTMNTINLIDGLDGLAAGISAIAALFLAAWASEGKIFYLPSSPHHEDLYLPLALAGALIGFLPYNWHPARIFLGDSGTMFLGLSLGALSIIGPAKLATALLVLMIPVLDVAWAIVRRRLRGRSFLTGDRQHVHYRLLEMGLSHRMTVLLFYALCIALAVLDLYLFKLQKLIAFTLLAGVIGLAFIGLEVRASRLPLLALDAESATASTRAVPEDEPEDHQRVRVSGERVGHPVFAEIDDREKDPGDPQS